MKKITLTLAVLSLLSAAFAETTAPLQKIDNSSIAKQNNIRPGTILYKFKDDAHPRDLKKFNALVNKTNLLSQKEIKGLNVSIVKIKGILGVEQSFAKKLEATGAVVFAEADAMVEHSATPNDPGYYDQWHHQTIGSAQAWDISTGSNAVKVCVLDTGVDTDHPDLVSNLMLPGYNSRLSTSGNVEDVHGHGTGTAGVIAAQGNNGMGVSGVNWDTQILPVQINISNTNSSAYISDMAKGIEWCADNGAQIANLSYGGIQYQTINQAAIYLRSKGGLLFMSSGNSGAYHDSVTFPDYTSFIAVGATNSSDVKSSFSEYGPYVDLVAGGESILTTYLAGQYVYYGGTSFSSPMAAGVGALLLSINPNLTPSELEAYLFSTAKDLGVVGEDDSYGHGRVDLGLAATTVYNEISTPEPVNEEPFAIAGSDITSGDAPLNVNFNAASSYDNDGTIVSYLWDFEDGTTSNTDTVSHVFNNAGTYSVTLTVTDDKGATNVSAPITISVAEPYNNPPLLNVSIDNISGEAPLSVNVDTSGSSDVDGSISDYIVDFGNGITLHGSQVSHTYIVPGSYSLVASVVDDGGASTNSDIFTITVLEPVNNPPVAEAFLSKTLVDIGESISFDATSSSDSDGSIVRYTWDMGNGQTLDGSLSTYAYPQSGTYTISLEVEDNDGSVVSTAPIQITVNEAVDTSIDTPTNLQYLIDGNDVVLNWDHSLKANSVFDIYKAQKVRGKYAYNLLTTTSTNTFRDTNVEKGSYKYKVLARDTSSNESSAFSNEVLVVVETAATEPVIDNPLPVLSATLNGNTVSLLIAYTCPENESCIYEVQKGIKSGKNINWSSLLTTASQSASIDEASGTYYYKVRVDKDSGVTDFSEDVKIRIR